MEYWLRIDCRRVVRLGSFRTTVAKDIAELADKQNSLITRQVVLEIR